MEQIRKLRISDKIIIDNGIFQTLGLNKKILTHIISSFSIYLIQTLYF
jgi:hypothetical protein